MAREEACVGTVSEASAEVEEKSWSWVEDMVCNKFDRTNEIYLSDAFAATLQARDGIDYW